MLARCDAPLEALGELSPAALRHYHLGAVTIAFIVGTSFLPRTTWLESLDVIFGFIILTDFSARLYVSPHPMREFAHPATWADMAAIVSFLAPIVGEGLGFLRILRTLRLLHAYQVIARLRADSSFFRRNEEVITAVVNIAVFLFIMTGFVYQTHAVDASNAPGC